MARPSGVRNRRLPSQGGSTAPRLLDSLFETCLLLFTPHPCRVPLVYPGSGNIPDQGSTVSSGARLRRTRQLMLPHPLVYV